MISCVVRANKIITREAKTCKSIEKRTFIDVFIKGLEGLEGLEGLSGRVVVTCSHYAYQILENMKNFPNGMAKYNC
jgi:hypothetical protein